MRILPMLLTAAGTSIATPVAAQSAVGDWSGVLGQGPGALRVVVHIAQGPDGALSGTLDSPDQDARGIALAEVTAEGDRLSFTVPAVGGRYAATWHPGTREWRGAWDQGLGPTPLDLRAGADSAPPPLRADWAIPADDAIAKLIEARNAPRPGQGIVVGVIEPAGPRIVAGSAGEGDSFSSNTLFEIGSITKVFTGLLLADMVNKGEVRLDDAVETYLPEGVSMPARGGRAITLADLATHTSGLPRLPGNMPFGDPANPYADYTEALLLAFLDGYELERDVGAQWDYSNLGVGLLGYLLGRAAGLDYETLLRQRITGPLGMADTAIALRADQQARFAPGFDPYLQRAKPWDLAVLAGAGGLRSTADDMLAFARAALDPTSPIGAAMETALSVRRPTGAARMAQALGWQVRHPAPGREILTHDGGTGGFRSALMIEPGAKRAAIVLVNSAAEPSATDLASHLLLGTAVVATPAVPPAPPPVTDRTPIDLPVAELERVVGRYEFGSGVVFEVTRDGETLRAKREGEVAGPLIELLAVAPLSFVRRGGDAQVRFTTDASGQVTGAAFTQGGATMTGKRLETVRQD